MYLLNHSLNCLNFEPFGTWSNTMLLYSDKRKQLLKMTFLLNEQNVSVMYIDINATSLCVDLSIFEQDECLGSKLRWEVEYAKSNLKTWFSQTWVICHLLPFVRVGQIEWISTWLCLPLFWGLSQGKVPCSYPSALFLIVPRHVSFGRPWFLIPWGVQLRAVPGIKVDGIRHMCPSLLQRHI